MASESPIPRRPDELTQFAVLLFTDICDSTLLKARHGALEYRRVAEMHNRMFEELAAEEKLTLIKNTGDGYFARSLSVAAVVRFALRFQHAMRTAAWPGFPIVTRVGIHAGEVADITTLGQADVLAPAADLVARVMGLAVGGQILLTRWPFDEARHFVRMHPQVDSGEALELAWLAHGPYLFKGCDEAVEIFEVGAAGAAPLVTPPDGEKAKRVQGSSGLVESPAEDSRMRELENRRAKLEAEVERLKSDERLTAERDWLAREKAVLDAAKRDFAEQEAKRREQLAAEKGEAEAMRQGLARQQALLEEKLAEQQRLEQEIEAWAAAEAERTKHEAETLRSELASRDAKIEEELRTREAEFRAREERNLARVEELRKEAEELQKRLHDEERALRESELRQSQRSEAEKAAGSVVGDTLAAEEERLDALRHDLETRLADWERGRKRRTLGMFIGVPLLILLAGVAAYLIKVRFVDIRTLPGEKQWQVALDESRSARAEKNWQALLNWCVTTDESLRAQPEFGEALRKHQRELAELAAEAIRRILADGPIPDGSTEEGRKFLLNLEKKTAQWDLPPERLLLIAKMRMPEAVARGDGEEALDAYVTAATATPEAARALEKELVAALRGLREQLLGRRMVISIEFMRLVDDVVRVESRTGSLEANRFQGELLAEEARRKGRLDEALQFLVETLELNPAWLEALRPQVAEILAQVAKLPAPDILPLAGVLRNVGDKWKNADAYLALADIESDEKARVDDYTLADRYGSMRARALVGRMMLDRGFETADAALAAKGTAKLREAVEAGEPEAMLLLGEALVFGRGVAENAAEALDLAARAESKGHAEAFFLAAKARLRQGEDSRDPAKIAEAVKGLEKAVEKNLPGAAYLLFIANYNPVHRDDKQALKALETGAQMRDVNCLYVLGKAMYEGKPPAERNQTRGKALIEDAAKLGSKAAEEWLRKSPQ